MNYIVVGFGRYCSMYLKNSTIFQQWGETGKSYIITMNTVKITYFSLLWSACLRIKCLVVLEAWSGHRPPALSCWQCEQSKGSRVTWKSNFHEMFLVSDRVGLGCEFWKLALSASSCHAETPKIHFSMSVSGTGRSYNRDFPFTLLERLIKAWWSCLNPKKWNFIIWQINHIN